MSQSWLKVNNAVGDIVLINVLFKSKNTQRRIVEMYCVLYCISIRPHNIIP
jgi:hypothetical protein